MEVIAEKARGAGPKTFADGGPPGAPPRDGLVWKASTHRWVNPHTGEEHDHAGNPVGPAERKTEADALPGIQPGPLTGKPISGTAFRFNRAGLRGSGDKFWSRERDYAEAFGVEVGGKGDIEEGQVSLTNPLHVVAKPHQFSDPSFENPIIAAAKKRGHDGVIFEQPDNGDAFYVKFGG